MPSQLGQWPCQIKLVPVNAPYFNGAKLLIAADCTAYAYANIHQEFMQGRITLIGCRDASEERRPVHSLAGDDLLHRRPHPGPIR